MFNQSCRDNCKSETHCYEYIKDGRKPISKEFQSMLAVLLRDFMIYGNYNLTYWKVAEKVGVSIESCH